MNHRFLNIYDINQKPFNEGDHARIQVKNIPKDHSIWRSNFGDFLTKHKFDLVTIKFENHYPRYNFSAHFSFYPLKLASEIEGNNKIEGEKYFSSRITDTQFINFLESCKIMEKIEDTNYQANSFAPDCELNLYYPNGDPIKVNDTLVFPVNDEFYSLTSKPEWIEKYKQNKVTEINIKLSLDGINLKTEYSKIKENGTTLKYREVLDIPLDDPFGDEDYCFGPIFHKKDYLEWFLEQAKKSKLNYFKK